MLVNRSSVSKLKNHSFWRKVKSRIGPSCVEIPGVENLQEV